jgi:hypothetical protein
MFRFQAWHRSPKSKTALAGFIGSCASRRLASIRASNALTALRCRLDRFPEHRLEVDRGLVPRNRDAAPGRRRTDTHEPVRENNAFVTFTVHSRDPADVEAGGDETVIGGFRAMKALFALFATVSLLPAVAFAQQTTAVEAPADLAITTCSVTSDASSRSASFSWGSSNSGQSPKGAELVGGAIGGGGGIASAAIVRITTTPSSNGSPPTVTAMAINTKGMVSGDRTAMLNNKHPELMRAHAPASDPTEHSIKTKGCGGSERIAATTGTPIRNPGGQVVGNSRGFTPRATCSISADGSSVSVSGLPLPSPSKVSIQDLHFVSSSDAIVTGGGPGGGPRVLSRCSGADGALSEVTMLLLPAVQK